MFRSVDNIVHDTLKRRDKGDYDHALADLNNVLSLDPKSAPALEGRSRVSEDKGAYANAVADLDQAIAIMPDWALIYEHRGHLRWRLGDATGALADYDRNLELDPERAHGWNLRCLARAVKGCSTRPQPIAQRQWSSHPAMPRSLTVAPSFGFNPASSTKPLRTTTPFWLSHRTCRKPFMAGALPKNAGVIPLPQLPIAPLH